MILTILAACAPEKVSCRRITGDAPLWDTRALSGAPTSPGQLSGKSQGGCAVMSLGHLDGTRSPLGRTAESLSLRVDQDRADRDSESAALATLGDAVAPAQGRGDRFSAQREAAGIKDEDQDGIEDLLEDALAQRFAPVVYWPEELDWIRPASVEWYLPRVDLRFHHSGVCPRDHEILSQVTPGSLIAQNHAEARLGWQGCGHGGPTYHSGNVADFTRGSHFFLEHKTRTIRPGPTNPRDWVTYAHVYPNDLGGITLQYWFFYPYNDGFSVQNHEGDWEGIQVKLDPGEQVNKIVLYAHGIARSLPKPDLGWHAETHPLVYAGAGTHATYASEKECDFQLREGADDSCCSHPTHRWFTYAGGKGSLLGIQGGGVINVGERDLPRNGQSWIQYGDTWGKMGRLAATSGPLGPAFKGPSVWDHERR